MLKTVEPWLLTSLPQKLVTRGVEVVSDETLRFQMTSHSVPTDVPKISSFIAR